MSLEVATRLLLERENIRLEFKEARTALPKNLFESICAMLNRDGGDVLLGVDNDGTVLGIEQSEVDTMVANMVRLSNNAEKLDPPFILFPMKLEIQGKCILHIQIPCSSQLHKSAGVVFDRSNDGDFRVVNPAQIADLYNNKRSYFTENTLYPYLTFSDFKPELFPKIRNLIHSNNPYHPWLALSDEQMLEKAGLWKLDYQTGQSGYTLAAALLLGKDEVIQRILPHYKIDALVRKKDLLRYDDRLYIQTNLVEAYEQLMDFVAKHLPDKFFQVGDKRISLRAHIFREIVANIIVHREYTNAHPCLFVIKKGRVETENANNAHGSGPIDLQHFVPFAKNPTLAKFFVQLGWVDELGSGVINVNKYIHDYADGVEPMFIEGQTFKMVIPIPIAEGELLEVGGATVGATVGAFEGTVEGTIEGTVEGTIEGITEGVKNKLTALLIAIASNEGYRVPFYQEATGLSDKSLERFLKQLRDNGLIEFKGEALHTGGYFLTEQFRKKLQDKTK